MSEIREWKRVRVGLWTRSNDVRVKTIRRIKPKHKDVTHQLMNNLIGITVPVEGRGVTVMPMEYMDNGHPAQYRKIDCTSFYMLVKEADLSVLGEAYDVEVGLASRGCRAHGVEFDRPEDLRWQRLKERFHVSTADGFLAEHVEADNRKEETRKRLGRK